VSPDSTWKITIAVPRKTMMLKVSVGLPHNDRLMNRSSRLVSLSAQR
jgi:hypothetical protein